MSRKSLTKLSNCWRDLLTPDYYTPIHSNHPGSPCRFRIVSSTFTLVTDCHSKLTSPFEFLWEKLILTKPVLPSQIIGRQSATLTTFKGSLAPEGGVRGVAVTAATGAGTRGGARDGRTEPRRRCARRRSGLRGHLRLRSRRFHRRSRTLSRCSNWGSRKHDGKAREAPGRPTSAQPNAVVPPLAGGGRYEQWLNPTTSQNKMVSLSFLIIFSSLF